jgi:phage-related protein
MAEPSAEVGSAYVTILPSARGFRRELQRQLGGDFDQTGRDAGRRIADGAETELGDRGPSIGARFSTRLLSGLGNLAASAARITAFGTAAASAGGGVASLAAQLAPAVGILAALPAAAAGGAVAFGALRLALVGVGDAFSAALGNNAAKFTKALSALSPAARAVAVELRTLKPAFDGLRGAVQQALFAPLQGQLTALTRTLAGPLRSGLSGIAAQFGQAGRALAVFARQGDSVNALSVVMISVRQAIAALTPALAPLLAGLRDLAAAVAPLGAPLASAIASAAARFGQWASQAAASGRALGWVQGAAAVFGQLGTVVVNVGSVLSSVMRAATAAGGSLFTVLGAVTDQLASFLQTAAGQQALTSFFAALRQVGAALGQVLGAVLPPLGQVIAALAPLLAALAGHIARLALAVSPLLSTIGQLVGQLSGALTPAVAVLSPIIAQLAELVGLILGEALRSLVAAVIPLLPMLARLVATIGTALTQALIQMAPALAQGVQELASLLPALAPILPLLGQLVTALLPVLVELVRSWQPVQAQTVQAVRDLLPALISILPPLVELIRVLAPLIAAFIRLQLEVTAKVIPVIATLISWIVRLGAATIGQQLKAVTWMIRNVPAAWNAVRAAVAAAVTAIMTAVGRFAALPARFAAWFGGAQQAASARLGALVTLVRGIPGRITAALGNLGGLLVSAGQRVIQGLIDGIRSKISSLTSTMSGVAGTIRSFLPFSPAKTGPLSGRGNPQYSGVSIGRMLAHGIDRSRPLVDAASSRIASAAQITAGAAGMQRPAFAAAGSAAAGGATYNIHVTPQQVALDEAGLLHAMRVAELRARVGRPR